MREKKYVIVAGVVRLVFLPISLVIWCIWLAMIPLLEFLTDGLITEMVNKIKN